MSGVCTKEFEPSDNWTALAAGRMLTGWGWLWRWSELGAHCNLANKPGQQVLECTVLPSAPGETGDVKSYSLIHKLHCWGHTLAGGPLTWQSQNVSVMWTDRSYSDRLVTCMSNIYHLFSIVMIFFLMAFIFSFSFLYCFLKSVLHDNFAFRRFYFVLLLIYFFFL